MTHKIILQGKEYPCRITLGAMIQFKREVGHDVSQMSGDMEEMAIFVHCCIARACRADGVAFDMDFDSFVDALTPADLQAFYTGMEDSPTATDGEKKTSIPT